MNNGVKMGWKERKEEEGKGNVWEKRKTSKGDREGSEENYERKSGRRRNMRERSG